MITIDYLQKYAKYTSDYDFPKERDTYVRVNPVNTVAYRALGGMAVGTIGGSLFRHPAGGGIIGAGVAAATSLPSIYKYVTNKNKYMKNRENRFDNKIVKGWRKAEDTYTDEMMNLVHNNENEKYIGALAKEYKRRGMNPRDAKLEHLYAETGKLRKKIGDTAYECAVRNNFREAPTKAKNRELFDFIGRGAPPTNIAMPGTNIKDYKWD